MKGIDVSIHNGTIDFTAVKNSGFEVVIIKATEGVSYVDPLLEEHYSGAIGAGLLVGFYHFMSEKTSPTQQAIDYYNAIKDKIYNIIPALDIEVNNYKRTAVEVTDRCLEFLNKFKDLSGLDCVIYTGGYFGRDNLDSRIKSYKAWIAHYGVNLPMATGFSKVVGHQYSEKGQITGINGNVDLNNFNDEIVMNRNTVSNNEKPKANDWISRLQEECNRQGFSSQVVDGIPGPNTLAGCPMLKQGTQGNITKLLQEKLVSLGYNTNGIDGIFGSATKNAVIQFQNNKGLLQDGIVGKNTWNKLIY